MCRLGLIGWLEKMVNGRGQMESGCTTRLNYIEHHVSKLDTLAGVAIKYGVEVKHHLPPLYVILVFLKVLIVVVIDHQRHHNVYA